MRLEKLLPLTVIVFFIVVSIPFRYAPVLDQESQIAQTAMELTTYNNYTLPTIYSVNGFTRLIGFGEKPLQIYIVTVPYRFLSNIIQGNLLTTFDVSFLIKFLFLVLCIATILLFCKKITGSYKPGYLAILVLAVAPVTFVWYAMTSWYGDFFDPILILFAILLLLYSIDNFDKNKLAAYSCALISVLSIMFAYFLWNGGQYAPVAYIFVISIIALAKLSESNVKIIIAEVVAMLIGYALYILSTYNQGFYPSLGSMPGYALSLLTQQSPNFLFDTYFVGTAFYPILLIAGFILFTLLPVWSAYLFLSKKTQLNRKAYLAVLLLFLLGIPAELSTGRFDTLMILPLVMLSGISITLLKSKLTKIIIAIAILILLIAGIYQLTFGTVPDNNTTAYFVMAHWIGAHTPPNSTILTYYQDSAPIELYAAPRVTYTDAWSGYNSILIRQFSNFLLQRGCNFTYLAQLKPDYLVINKWWQSNKTYEYHFFINSSGIPNVKYSGSNLELLSNNNQVIAHNGTTLILINDSILTNIYQVYQNYTLLQIFNKTDIIANSTSENTLIDQSKKTCYLASG